MEEKELIRKRNEKGYIGYVDAQGNEVIPFIYLSGSDFQYNYAFVERAGENEKLIDLEGKTIITFETDDIVFGIHKEGEKVFLNIFRDGIYGVIDLEENILLPFEYDDIDCYTEKGKAFFVVEKCGKFGVVNLKEEVILPFEYRELTVCGEEKKWLIADKDGVNVVIDIKGNIILPFEYENLNVFSEEKEELLIAKKDGISGVIDLEGNIIIPFEYDKLDSYDAKDKMFLIAEKKGRYGAINLNREVILPFEYGYLDFLDDEEEAVLMIAEKDKKMGIIDLDGSIILPFEYDDIGLSPYFNYDDGDFWNIQKKESEYRTNHGVINKYGKVVVPCKYDQVIVSELPKGKKILFTASDITDWEMYYSNGKTVFSCSYNFLHPYEDGEKILVIFEKDKKIGIMDLDGNVLLAYKHELSIFDIHEIDGKIFLELHKDWKRGIMDIDGNIIIPCKYDVISYEYKDKKWRVEKGEEWGMIDMNGCLQFGSLNKPDHIAWLKKIQTASLNKEDVRQLRKEIFENTVKYVQSGYYVLKNKDIAIDNRSIVSEYFDKPEKLQQTQNYKTKFSVINADCLETAEMLLKSGFNPCVLNLASGKNPGGGVMNGSAAQEENLFRRTNLFVSLYQFASYAEEYGIKKHENSYPLDKNTRGIYSKNITVFRGSEKNGYCLLSKPFRLSFVTVPAVSHPELVLIENQYFLADKWIEPTKEKIRTILRIAGKYQHDSLVLGAFGCGAFANPPHHIAKLFREVFSENEFSTAFKYVVFSIFEDQNSGKQHNPNGNVLPFFEVFDSF